MSASVPGALISVVITCYNLERYIAAAIRSALDQVNAGPFEVIVVDDASTDGSAALIAAFPVVRLVRMPENSGVMLATVAGINAARGDVVCLLDGDDIWEPGKLEAMRKAFSDQAIALATHDLTCMDAAGHAIQRGSRPSEVLGALADDQRSDAIRRGILRIEDYVWLGSALSIRKSAARWDDFSRLILAREDGRHLYQDWPLAFWIAAQRDAGLIYVDQPLFRYRLHGANHSGDTGDAARAARNYHRSACTMSVTADICTLHLGLEEPRLLSLAHGAIFRANAAVNQGRRSAAIREITRSLPGLARYGWGYKAVAKLLLVGLLGRQRINRAKTLIGR